jgi:hypothetical protein
LLTNKEISEKRNPKWITLLFMKMYLNVLGVLPASLQGDGERCRCSLMFLTPMEIFLYGYVFVPCPLDPYSIIINGTIMEKNLNRATIIFEEITI